MCTLFQTSCKRRSFARGWSSSAGSRNAERGSLMSQAVSSLGSAYTTIPGKFAQCMISGFTLFRPDIHNSERIIHIMQAMLAAAETSVAIMIFYQDKECSPLTGDLCKTALLLKLLYTGTLTAASAVSELSKDPYQVIPEEAPSIPLEETKLDEAKVDLHA